MGAPACAEARICWGAATFVQNTAGQPIMAPGPVPFRALPASEVLVVVVVVVKIIFIVEAGDHEDTSLSIVSADKAAESGEAPRNREERVARNGVGSNPMCTRVPSLGRGS